jgi:branched-chain amino acid transport system ATP-binding protein
LLELQELRVSYGAVEVVHGIDARLAGGEVVGMIGPNGAGKSSILRAICGLRAPSAGRVCFEGRDLRGMAPEQIARLGLALVPEGRGIFKTLTVQENLQLAPGGEDCGGVERALQMFPSLGRRLGLRAERLSGGEQQQLAIARALIGEPKLLILDEPSLGLAPKVIDAVYELLDSLRRRGMTMLVAEQNAARTIAFSDRCLVIKGGYLLTEVEDGKPGVRPELPHAYVGDDPERGG